MKGKLLDYNYLSQQLDDTDEVVYKQRLREIDKSNHLNFGREEKED